MTCVPWTLDQGCCSEWDGYESAVQERAESLAWSTLRLLTAGMVGNCEATFRPCIATPCTACTAMYGWMYPGFVNGQPVNRVCGSHQCSCPALSEVVFSGQVAYVEQVLEDGAPLPYDAYRLDGNRLVRVDGGVWPACQDMSLGEDAIGTLVIKYIPGVVPGVEGEWAAGVLACEYAKACAGARCRLPSSVVSITRQGVSMDMGRGMFPDGQTGIREVDAFILSVNPNALKTPPLVWSPDTVYGRATGIAGA